MGTTQKCCVLFWTNHGSSTPQHSFCNTSHLKNIQVRWTRHARHCWRSKDEPISNVLLWTPTHGLARVDRPARTNISSVWTRDVVCRTWRERWMIGKSMLLARLDDDDNIYIYIYQRLCKRTGQHWRKRVQTLVTMIHFLIYFMTKIPGKDMNPLFSTNCGLNCITIVFLQWWPWH